MSVQRAKTTSALIVTYLLMRSYIIVLDAKVKLRENLIASRWTREGEVECIFMTAWIGVTGRLDLDY